jgi:hypothetical protein
MHTYFSVSFTSTHAFSISPHMCLLVSHIVLSDTKPFMLCIIIVKLKEIFHTSESLICNAVIFLNLL